MRTPTTEGRAKARMMGTADLLAVLAKPYVKRLLETNGADIELVGRWIWIVFMGKPSARCRTFLKCIGFRWNRRRGLWQHNCGRRSVRSGADPRLHYGSLRVNGDDAEVLAAVAGGA